MDQREKLVGDFLGILDCVSRDVVLSKYGPLIDWLRHPSAERANLVTVGYINEFMRDILQPCRDDLKRQAEMRKAQVMVPGAGMMEQHIKFWEEYERRITILDAFFNVLNLVLRTSAPPVMAAEPMTAVSPAVVVVQEPASTEVAVVTTPQPQLQPAPLPVVIAIEPLTKEEEMYAMTLPADSQDRMQFLNMNHDQRATTIDGWIYLSLPVAEQKYYQQLTDSVEQRRFLRLSAKERAVVMRQMSADEFQRCQELMCAQRLSNADEAVAWGQRLADVPKSDPRYEMLPRVDFCSDRASFCGAAPPVSVQLTPDDQLYVWLRQADCFADFYQTNSVTAAELRLIAQKWPAEYREATICNRLKPDGVKRMVEETLPAWLAEIRQPSMQPVPVPPVVVNVSVPAAASSSSVPVQVVVPNNTTEVAVVVPPATAEGVPQMMMPTTTTATAPPEGYTLNESGQLVPVAPVAPPAPAGGNGRYILPHQIPPIRVGDRVVSQWTLRMRSSDREKLAGYASLVLSRGRAPELYLHTTREHMKQSRLGGGGARVLYMQLKPPVLIIR